MTEVNVVVNAIHFNADSKLIDFIESRVNKLTKLYENIIECQVILRLENGNPAGNKVVEIKIGVPGNYLFAKRFSKTFEESTDAVIEALRKQLKKRKEKVWGI